MLQFLQTTRWRVSGGPFATEQEVTWLPGLRISIAGIVYTISCPDELRIRITGLDGRVLSTMAWMRERVEFFGRTSSGWLSFYTPEYPAPLIKWLSNRVPFVSDSFGSVSGTLPDTPHPTLLTVDQYDGPFLRGHVKALSHKDRMRVAVDASYSAEFVDVLREEGIECLYTPCSLHYPVCVVMCAARLMEKAAHLHILTHSGTHLKVTTDSWKNFPALWAYCNKYLKGSVDWHAALAALNTGKSLDDLRGISAVGLLSTFGCANIVSGDLS